MIDESGFTKKGTHSVGVARQHDGRPGKVDNCQAGVFLIYVTPDGSALLDHRLYLPGEWVNDPKRREETRIPDDVAFRTKPQLAGALVEAARADGLPHDWIIADELYGRDGASLGRLEAINQRYLMEVPVSTTVWTKDPATEIPPYGGRGQPPERPSRDSVRTVRQVAESLSPSTLQTLRLRDGAKDPLAFEFAAVRVWQVRQRHPGPSGWHPIRRSPEPGPEVKHYISHVDAPVPLETLAQVTGVRHRVEELFEECKGYPGMGHYEARAWTSWHHYMALVAVAHLFLNLTRLRLKEKTPVLI